MAQAKTSATAGPYPSRLSLHHERSLSSARKELPKPFYTFDGYKFHGFGESGSLTRMEDKIRTITSDLHYWVGVYCAPPDEIEARMTAQQKQDIVDFLGEWCLFNDWDSLVAAFPRPEKRFQIFTQAVVMKDIFQSLLENPFYYIDLESHQDGRLNVLPPPYGKQLYQHWRKILPVDEAGAEKWRIATVQMMNKYLEPTVKKKAIVGLYPVEAEDPSAGIRSWNVRLRYVNQLSRHMLGKSSLISPMLREHDPEDATHTMHEPFRRHGQMRYFYEMASTIGVQMWVADRWTYRFDDNIRGIEPYTEKKNKAPDWHRQKRWWPCFSHHGERDDLLGRTAVMIMWPTVWVVRCNALTPPPRPNMPIAEYCRKTGEVDKEWAYVDDRDWCYHVTCPGSILLGKEGVVNPHAKLEDTHPK